MADLHSAGHHPSMEKVNNLGQLWSPPAQVPITQFHNTGIIKFLFIKAGCSTWLENFGGTLITQICTAHIFIQFDKPERCILVKIYIAWSFVLEYA